MMGGASITVIKSGSPGEASAISRITPDTPSERPRAPTTEELKISALNARVAELERTMKEDEARHDRALIAAREEAAQEAAAAHKRRDDAALDVLRAGLETALLSLAEKLSTIENLAALFAGNAMRATFSDTATSQANMQRAIRRQLEDVRRETVLCITVSSADFADTQALDRLAQAIGLGAAEIARSDDLTAGECHIDLRLGRIELSLETYWTAIERLVARVSAEANA